MEKNTTFTQGKILQPLILFALPVLFALFFLFLLYFQALIVLMQNQKNY